CSSPRSIRSRLTRSPKVTAETGGYGSRAGAWGPEVSIDMGPRIGVGGHKAEEDPAAPPSGFHRGDDAPIVQSLAISGKFAGRFPASGMPRISKAAPARSSSAAHSSTESAVAMTSA